MEKDVSLRNEAKDDTIETIVDEFGLFCTVHASAVAGMKRL